MLYAARIRSDRSAKQNLLRRFLRGYTRDTIGELAEGFANRWVDHNSSEAGMERLRYHAREGYRVLLLSASPDVYVPAIAQCLEVKDKDDRRKRFDESGLRRSFQEEESNRILVRPYASFARVRRTSFA